MKKRTLALILFISACCSLSLYAARDTIPPVTTASPGGDLYTGSVSVTLEANESRVKTYYCTGSSQCEPNNTYAGAIQINASTVLRFYSMDQRHNMETIKSEIYEISARDTSPPITTASPAGGNFSGSVTVTLASSEPGTTYYCTGNNCNPTTVYSMPLVYSATTTLRYFSKDLANNSEGIKSQTYTIQNQACNPEPVLSQHSNLSWAGDYQVCAGCHPTKVNEVRNSAHYQWKGSAAEMVSGATQQGKIVQADASGNILPGTSAMNAYCINILGNWNGCSSCHIGLGSQPTTSSYNVDCLVCHQKLYKRKKVSGIIEPDTANMCVSMDTAVKTVHRPTRDNCVQCHSFGGGGDNFKRGDLAAAHANTTDTVFDRHMATNGGNLRCQSCHIASQHKIAGRGSDLRPLDSTAIVTCTNCHSNKASSSGHSTPAVDLHVGRLACQTCHIPTYAKNAADTAASEATEIHRDWTMPEWNAGKSRWEPTPTKANNLIPKYLHWNGTSWGYNLKDNAVLDPQTGAYQMSRPHGGINDINSMLYPFKYKTAKQAFASALNLIIPIDTAKYWSMPTPPAVPTTADINSAVVAGLANLSLNTTTPVTWVTTDEYQLIAHEVPTASNNVLTCTKCHITSTATQMKLATDLGYSIKKPTSDLCNDCHSLKAYTSSYSNFLSVHDRHAGRRDCSHCHNFSRPENGLN